MRPSFPKRLERPDLHRDRFASNDLPPAAPRPVFWFRLGACFATACFVLAAATAWAVDSRGCQFLGLSRFSAFAQAPGTQPGERVLTSPALAARIPWDELVISWNADMPEDAWLKVEVRALYPERATKYYTMALYSGNPARHPRQSVGGQKDADGDVATDTLILKAPCRKLQVRLTLGAEGPQPPGLRFLGITVDNTKARPAVLPPNQAAWGRVLDVPERSQMAYSNGVVLCSPTTLSMILGFWGRKLHRPELERGVPEVAQAVYDPVWKGTGNWAFNTAYAGSFPGLRAYVTRLSDIAELEDWVAAGFPVVLSVCANKLSGRDGPPSGHLIVCAGFTPEGDVIINDPGRRQNVRRIVPRKNVISAWAYSKNAVYLIYPEDAKPPKDRFGHWDSRKG